MNVCVGDIIKLENNQFVAVRDQAPRSAYMGTSFCFSAERAECLLPCGCPLNARGRELLSGKLVGHISGPGPGSSMAWWKEEVLGAPPGVEGWALGWASGSHQVSSLGGPPPPLQQ